MAAGLGFKTFTTGEVLTAADTNGYLMQGVLVFASAAARDAAITSPQEGQFAYLKDTNVTTYYTGAAWANLDTTGMTNPMTTTGDIVYASSGSTPGRIGIGSTGNVLTVAGGIPSWAAPASGSTYVGASTNAITGTVANDTLTALTFGGTDLWDTDNFHDTSSNTSRMTVPAGKAGKYLITFFYQQSGSNSTGSRPIYLYKNGSDIGTGIVAEKAVIAYGTYELNYVVNAAVSDYYEIVIRQTSGGSMSFSAATYTFSYLGA